jgi:hypothetical protein
MFVPDLVRNLRFGKFHAFAADGTINAGHIFRIGATAIMGGICSMR